LTSSVSLSIAKSRKEIDWELMEIKGVVMGYVSGVVAYKGWSESPVVGKTPR
jgi:hypothetical protein